MWTLQLSSYHAFEQQAQNRLFTFKDATGFLGGNVTETADTNDGGTFRMQAFFLASKPSPDVLEFSMDSLPDGAKHVFVPPVLQRWYGFTEAN